MFIRPLVVDWKGLKKMGWPYCRVHTWRLMFDPDYADNRFPLCHKLGNEPGCRVLWRVVEILAYLETHGLTVTEDWHAPS